LYFSIDGIPVIDHIFVHEKEGNFILAQWKVIAATFSITEKTDGKKLCTTLRKLAVEDHAAIVSQIIELERQPSAVEGDINRQEAEMNSLVYSLYGLTESEVATIEKG
jgi:hypothetical protein